MDPNAVLANLLAAFAEPDHQDARENALGCMEDLRKWLERGGFMPRYVGLKPFTVLLRYPDYLSSDGETYLAHVVASDASSAVGTAQRLACGELADEHDSADFAELMVFSGHISALKREG